MRVPGKNLVYFAFPKSGSELMRMHLNLNFGLHWNNAFDPKKWDACSILYCHARPSRTVFAALPSDSDVQQMFTVVRNTYARLVSAYNYILIENKPNFDEFIQLIADAVRDNRFESIPLCWMFMPFDLYFAGVIDQLHVLQLDNFDELDAFLSTYDIAPIQRKVVNGTLHDDYRTYYTNPLTVSAVQHVYAYEIERFGYKLE